ncbi:MAG: hypothetical protein IPM57_03150 [Oligoflexia bacterium]|nr:hypothetical protein [Oligoflexia bacterium]
MYNLLIKLMLLGALLQLGISASDFFKCRTNVCMERLESKSRKVLKVNWKPISVFPKEAKRFK